jgi:hypothetical protein
VQDCLCVAQFKLHWAEFDAEPVGVPAVLLVRIEQGLTQAINALVQAYEQVEKVGPAGSPSGDEEPGTCVTPGVKVVWAWPVVRPLNRKRRASIRFMTRHQRRFKIPPATIAYFDFE